MRAFFLKVPYPERYTKAFHLRQWVTVTFLPYKESHLLDPDDKPDNVFEIYNDLSDLVLNSGA